jgi:PAS domain S-box-containing protein
MRQLRPDHEEHWFEIYGRIARTGVPARFQNEARTLGRWYDVYAFRIGVAEERKVAILFNDITANRLAEERLRQQTAQFETLLYNAPLAVYLADADLRLLAVNPAARKLFGDIPDPVGRSLEEVASVIWPAERSAEVIASFRRTLATGDPYVVPEWVEQRRGGGPTEYHEWQINRLPLPDGGFGVVCYARDITSHVRARQALCESERALKEADQRKDEFLATLAHELRNPLAPIRNAVQLLMAKGPPDPDLQWSRGIIDRQVTLMARLLEDLLDVSRISRNRLELRPELVDLAEVVRTAMETSRPMIEARGHQLSLQLPLQPVRLRADAVRLAQVFSNLLNNSAKFTEPGGHIWLTVERPDGEIRVSVKDTGIGIAPEMLPRIFDLFSQDSSAGVRTSEGLGIGLSLVKGLVEMHGGSIEARSSGPGLGSEFIVRLPLPEPEAPGLADGVATAARPPQIRHRVLVVDDNRDSADTLAMLLSVMGNEVRTAYGGEPALETAEDLRPDVVLLDVEMPGLDGHETCRRMREQAWARTAFIIALTGWGQETDRQRTREAGFDHHMVKPIDPDALESLLSSVPAPD